MPLRRDEVAYERRDASVSKLLLFGLVLAAAVGAVQAILWGLHHRLHRDTSAQAVSGAPPLRHLPPEPRLQGAPGDERLGQQQMSELVRATSAHLNSYGWVDRQAGLVHVPIERAMGLVAASGLPEWPAAADSAPQEPPPPVIRSTGPEAIRLDAFYGKGGGPGAQAPGYDPEESGPGAVVLPALRVASLLTVVAVVALIAWLLRQDQRTAGQAGDRTC